MHVGFFGGAIFEHSISSHFLHGPSFIRVSSAVQSFSSAFGIAPVVQTKPHAWPLIAMQSESFLQTLSTLMRSASSSAFASLMRAVHWAALGSPASPPPASALAVAASGADDDAGIADSVGAGAVADGIAVAAPGSVLGVEPHAKTAASPTLVTASAMRFVRVRMRRRLACVAWENNSLGIGLLSVAMAKPKPPKNPDEAALRELGLSFPETTEDFPWGHRTLKVRGKAFVFMGTGEEAGAKSGWAPKKKATAKRRKKTTEKG